MNLDKDIESQIDRAKELLEELKACAKKDLAKKAVSTKTRNLTQEILVKMRSVFDQSMYQFFDKKISPTLTKKEKDNARVYFPLVSKKGDLKSVLGRSMIKDLDSTNPKIFNFLDSIQPYNKDYEWLKHFSKFANEKHIRLTPQKKKETKSIFVGKRGTGFRITGNAYIDMGPNTSMSIGGKKIEGGQRISPDSDFIRGDPDLDVKKEKWVSFTLANSKVNAVNLCESIVNKGEKIIHDFFKLF